VIKRYDDGLSINWTKLGRTWRCLLMSDHVKGDVDGHDGAHDVNGADPAGVTSVAVRARWAITGVFFVNALLLASYINRIPSLQLDHRLSDGLLGVVLASFGVSAIVTMQFVGRLVGRFGSAAVIRLMLVLMPVMVFGIGYARNVPELVIASILTGGVHGTLDVSMNAHAVMVERRRDRPIMNGCHAAWSIGAVIATLVGAGLIHAHISPEIHFLYVGAFAVLAGWVVSRWLLSTSADRVEAAPAEEKAAGAPWHTGWTGKVLIFGLVGGILMICEAAVISWSGIFLHDERGASLAAASFGYTAFSAFQTTGRVVGDRLNQRFGGPRLFAISSTFAVAGLIIVVSLPFQAATIIGFAVTGAGTSVLLPLVFSTAGHAGGDGPGAATFVSRVSTFTYGGVVFGPALVGWFAQGFGLGWTFAGLIPLMIAVMLNGRFMIGHARARTKQTVTG
jgi:MFS family permease